MCFEVLCQYLKNTFYICVCIYSLNLRTHSNTSNNIRRTKHTKKVLIKDFFSKCDQIHNTADLSTFTEEILNGKFRFLYRNDQTKWLWSVHKSK